MFFFSKPFIGDLDYKIIRDCCKIWDEYWILRKNSWKSKCSGNARNQVRRLRYRFSNRMSGSILNIWILQFIYALVDFVAIVLFIVVSDLCQTVRSVGFCLINPGWEDWKWCCCLVLTIQSKHRMKFFIYLAVVQ